VTLDDYRRRYAQYRTDPDVQAAHAAHPFIATIDDHELADGAWRDGASEHDEHRYGPWAARRAAAFQARWEWLPARPPDPGDHERVFRNLPVGRLAELFLLDTRSRRDRPEAPPGMERPDRSALGAEQRSWLWASLATSNARWRLLGNPSVMARTWNDRLAPAAKEALLRLKLMDADGSGPDYDQWDGYPAERRALLEHIERLESRNVVVLSGDVHVGMANELAPNGTGPAAVEFVNSSLTSQNLDDKMGWAPRTGSLPLEEAFMAAMPHVRWCDFDSHGYGIVHVTAERLTFEWWAVDTVLERSSGESRVAAWSVPHGTARLEPAT
jgi:alkaline phosphatase D